MVPLVPESSELKRGIEVAGLPRQVIGGYQATVKFFCLDGEWENAVFVGEVRPDKAPGVKRVETRLCCILCAAVVLRMLRYLMLSSN